ncbi:hypothetical protein [Actinoplanes sp. NBRC 103695]|uniref:hypothetical protein n=1 Tax=Actinoplanes sp. NBRC 103695 TaxID=3032202 RepID=UPI002554928D|nr:hypothetical protein [Actinoplanes sp. NBRC 103695]
MTRSRLIAVVAALSLTPSTVPGEAQAAPEPKPGAGTRGAVPSPDTALGPSWRTSTDVLVAGAGDTDGYHLSIAREKDGFAWSTLATLTSTALEVGPWMGEVCVTGSGRWAVAVFAPKKAANRPNLMMAGGLAAVVDTSTGKAKHVATGLQLSHSNPACGPDDRALLTRVTGDEVNPTTELLTVDAAAGRVTGTRRLAGPVANPAPAPGGDYAVAGDHLVKIGAAGELTPVTKLTGRPFALRATSGAALDVVAVEGDRAVASRWAGGRLTRTGTGPVGNLQLFGQRGGTNVLVGTVDRPASVPGLRVLPTDRRVEAVSAQGHLLAEEVYSRQAAHSVVAPLERASEKQAGAFMVKVRAAAGRRSEALVVRTTAPQLDADPHAAPDRGIPAPVIAASVLEPSCAVPRNDPSVQPAQPSANQVEWAIDQAVHNRLFVNRPANFLKAGLDAYQPQQMFPRKSLSTGGTVPANLMLGIVAQETNMSQASWHVVPGDTGNPLIGSYYGNGGNLDVINYDDADCGYGIGQVTDGMRADSPVWNVQQKRAIAVDYAANIAASLNILIEKWNQIQAEPSAYRITLNNNQPQYIENWFVALWAYNSGFYPYANRNANPDHQGNFGIGWLNNPANTFQYSADRTPFLRYTMADAEHPNRWPYPERVLGWVETPQYKGYPVSTPAYSEPDYGDNTPQGPLGGGKVLSLPDYFDFCDTGVNNCLPFVGCPTDDPNCWWHGPVTFADCGDQECSTEHLAYSLGSGEPGVQRIYDRDCATFNEWADPQRDATKTVSMVYSLNNTAQHNLGCDGIQPQNGKFTLRLGDPSGAESTAPYAAVDLHQIGAGYKGHAWFTYLYPGNRPKRRVVGSWTPDLDLAPGTRANYAVLAHLPSHGADGHGTYVITTGATGLGEQKTCHINFHDETQWGIPGVLGAPTWVYLGTYNLGRGAQVQINNAEVVQESGEDSVAFGAMAFVPLANRTSQACGVNYPN